MTEAFPSEHAATRVRWREGVLVYTAAFLILWLALINDSWEDPYVLYSRMETGGVPYRDYGWGVWPGTTWVMTAWFRAFGTQMSAIRMLNALCGAATILFAWAIATRVLLGRWRWLGVVSVLGACVLGNEGVGHMTFSAPLALATIWAAIIADQTRSWRCWAWAGSLAACTGVFTQSTGALLGFAVLAASFLSERGARIRNALATGVAAAAVLSAMVLWLWLVGAWQPFINSTFALFDRYPSFMAGVRWGSWLLSWSPDAENSVFTVIAGIPWPCKPVALAAASASVMVVYVLPGVLACSALRSFLPGGARSQRVLLWLTAAAVLWASQPLLSPMRMARLSAPAWIVLVFELQQVFQWAGARKLRTLRWMSAGVGGAVALMTALLVFQQWSYAHQYEWVQTCRGPVRLDPRCAAMVTAVRQRFQPGERVFVTPNQNACAWLNGLENPTTCDVLVPALVPPEYYRLAIGELRAAGYPPVVMTEHPLRYREFIKQCFGPSKFLEELEPENDLLLRFLGQCYQPPVPLGPGYLLMVKPEYAGRR